MNQPLFHQLADTPHKRVKPNEESTFEHSKIKAAKISLFQRLNEFSASSRKGSMQVQISQFELPFQYKSSSSSGMDEQDEGIDMQQLNLGRKMTYMGKELYEQAISTLNLYRSNSTFDQRRSVQDLTLGDNIYLKQINSASKPLPKPKTNENGLRIEQDYQIQQNLPVLKKRHEHYICLNKLERVFYYVKKVMMSFDGKEGYEFYQHLTSLQSKIYHKDNEGSFLRFYQSWFEHNSLYLTYEVAVQSLQDCTLAHKRLREAEAWDLLRDCSRSLSWLYKHHNACHLNIKPGNILKCQRKFKFADPLLESSILQTYLKEENVEWDGWLYLAPQVKRFYTLIQGLDMRQSDIYSLGMCLIQNLVGERYFPREGKEMRMYLQKHIHGYSPSLIKTLLRMVSLDPTKRLTAEQLYGVEVQSEKTVKKRRFSI